MRDLWVHLLEPCLVLLEVIECAIMGLSVPMLRAEDVRALAGHLDDSYFLGALPTFVQVSLKKKMTVD